jgi:O-antigen/teichoic acid export membrane protein
MVGAGIQLNLSSKFGLRSTGLVVFSGRLLSAFTGLLFTVMAARWLSLSGFGTWEVIVTLVTFASYPVGTVAYWATRDVARGRMIGRTALAAGTLLSALGLLIYFGFSFVTYSRIAASVTPFLLGALLVPLSYWNAAASAVVTGYRPSVYGTSLIFSELAKVAVAYEALYVFHLGINGVIVALLTAYLVQSVVSTFMVRNATSEKFDPAEVKRWTRLSWLPALSYLAPSLAVADTYIVALLHGTTVVGAYQVAFIVASIVTYASGLIFSMYPLLLKGGDIRLPAVSLEFSLLFAIPMAVGCAVISTPILFLFGSKYTIGALGLVILAPMFVFNNISLLLDQTLMGTEKVDAGQTPTFRKLAGSNLLFVPAANIGYGIFYLVTLYLALSFAAAGGFSDSADVAVWALAQLVATVIFMLVKLRRARGVAVLRPGVSVLYYIVGAAVMAMVLYFASPAIAVQSVGTVLYGARLLVLVLLGAVVYFGVVYALDPKLRELARSAFRRFGLA